MSVFLKGRKENPGSVPLPGEEKRRFFRVECVLRTEFRLRDHGSWVPAEVLDLSVAGMKVRFDPFFRGKTLSPERFEWADSIFRFPLNGSFFQIEGCFLRVYLREAGRFTAGVEFTDPSPEDQFRLVELYGMFRRRSAGIL